VAHQCSQKDAKRQVKENAREKRSARRAKPAADAKKVSSATAKGKKRVAFA
jgi:hypothetical protein